MRHMDITLALLINAMAIFVLAAAVTSLGPSDPDIPEPVMPRDYNAPAQPQDGGPGE